jgi:MFS family permease
MRPGSPFSRSPPLSAPCRTRRPCQRSVALAPMLALGRALQGLGAAGMTSVNSALVRFTYPRRQLGQGIAMTAMAVSISSAAVPTIASVILAVASWPWLFAIDVPIGLLTPGLALRLLPYTPPSPHRFDVVSAVLSAVASVQRCGSRPSHPADRAVAGGRDHGRLRAGAPAGVSELAAASCRSLPTLGLCPFGNHLGLHLRRAGYRLCHLALLFLGRARSFPGRNRVVDDAMASHRGARCAGRKRREGCAQTLPHSETTRRGIQG